MPPKATSRTWHSTEDDLIKAHRTLSKPTSYASLVTLLNNLPDTPRNRTIKAIEHRWARLKQDQVFALNDVEMQALKKAVEEVEGREKWRFVAMRYGELVKGKEGVEHIQIQLGSAKRLYEEAKGGKKRKKETKKGEDEDGKVEDEKENGKAGGKTVNREAKEKKTMKKVRLARK